MNVDKVENEQAIGLLDNSYFQVLPAPADEEQERLESGGLTTAHGTTTTARQSNQPNGGWRTWIDRIKICGIILLVALVGFLGMACLFLSYWVILLNYTVDVNEEAATASEVHAPYHADLLSPVDPPSVSSRMTVPPDGAPCVMKGMNAYCSTGHDEKYQGECPYWQWYMTTSGWVLLPECFTDRCPVN